MRQGLTTSCLLTRGVLTHQLYRPTSGKWALWLINVRSSSSLPSSATTLSTSRPDTNLAPNTASLMCSGSGGAAVPLPLDHPAGRNPRTAANVPFPCPPACCHRILYPLGMMPLGPPHDSSTGRSERMLEGLLGGIGGSRFYRLLVGGSR